jgi:hypothetical protein
MSWLPIDSRRARVSRVEFQPENGGAVRLARGTLGDDRMRAARVGPALR